MNLIKWVQQFGAKVLAADAIENRKVNSNRVCELIRYNRNNESSKQYVVHDGHICKRIYKLKGSKNED